MRVGLGFDVHPFAEDRPLVLGGEHLEAPGLAGHSDGDAVAHAVADALLGAAGLGDLGSLFPASEERFRGADSLELLEDVARRVAAAGWRLANVDAVVVAEAPSLAPHVAAMEANLGEALAPVLPVGAAGPSAPSPVTVRPKRGEGVGSVGRGEGVAVWAVALLERESATSPGS